jgi:UvrD/REP helicase N-terminal domain
VPAYDYAYAEIVRVAAGLLGTAATRQRERDSYDAVFVDEYQDCDPAQEALLQNRTSPKSSAQTTSETDAGGRGRRRLTGPPLRGADR